MDDTFYETEAKRLLGDPMTYKKLDRDPFPELIQNLNGMLIEAREAGVLSRREFEHLFVREFNEPTFYIIPKVHKCPEKTPGRPIVSAVQGPLERIGVYLDSLLKEMVVGLKSYVQDTHHVLS